MKYAILCMGLLWASLASAQIDVGGMVKNKVNQRIEQKTNQAIDKTLDETEKGVKDAAKGNKKGKSKSNEGDAPQGEKTEESSSDNANNKKSLTTYSKFDFVPGEKVLILDQFENVAVGDYPVDWNTNGTAEIVTVDGVDGKWLQLVKEGVFMPDYITDLPENFTLQFDVIANQEFNYYSDWFRVTFLATQNRAKLNDFGKFSHPDNAVRFAMHPNNAGSTAGAVAFENWNEKGESLLKNEMNTTQFFVPNNNTVRVSVWRQKQRLRVYFNEEKVLDIPRAFSATAKYNATSFNFGGSAKNADKILIGNIRLAVGAPDTRSKLITEGKLVTRGILFDVGSDQIKPESYGTIKEIANVLKENPDVKVQIIGHTDGDGDEAANLELSKKRAAAVKAFIEKEFGIEASRLTTDGKGESQPADSNASAVGKANNRRVEFIKI